MAKMFLRRSVMDAIARDVAAYTCPGDQAEFSVEYQLAYQAVLDDLDKVNGMAIQAGAFPSAMMPLAINGLVFMTVPNDYFVDQAAAAIVPAAQSSLIMAR